MKHNFILVASVFVLSLVLSACGAVTPTRIADRPIESTIPVLPTETAIPTATIPAPTATPAIALTTHEDASGYTFDYPSEWMLDVLVFGSRAPGGYQITSWAHDPGMVSDVPADGTIINILVQLWDPKGNLDAFVAQRQLAWDASGIAIESEEEHTLENGNLAKAFVVKGADGAKGYFMFSTFGENYLVVSGNGDLEMIDLVARSMR